MNIICIRFAGGEEIIGKIINESLIETNTHNVELTSVTIEKTRNIIAQPLGNGKFGIGLLPWLIGNIDGKIKINLATNSNVLAVYKATEDIERAYIEQTSGIALAGSSPGISM